MAQLSEGPARFDLGRVLRQTVAAVGRNWAWLSLTALPLAFVPALIANWALAYAAGKAWIPRTGLDSLGPRAVIHLLLSFAPNAVLVGLVARRLVGHPNTRASSVAGLMPLMIVANLMITVGVWFASLLFIVPGVLLSLAWSVAIPVIAVEGLGPPACFDRSIDLTRNHRGAIFLLKFGFSVASFIFSFGVGMLLGLCERALRPALPLQVLVWISWSVVAMVSAVATTTEASLTGVIYRELSQIRRGVGARTLAAVFDYPTSNLSRRRLPSSMRVSSRRRRAA